MKRSLTYGVLAACVLGWGMLGEARRPQPPAQAQQQHQQAPQPPSQQPQPPAPSQQPVFRARGDAVRVFVTVTDRDGRLVTTLAQPDFEVRDEGAPQAITAFDNTPQPIRLIVMLDVSGSMQGNLPLLRAAAEQLFTRLRPDDAVRVGTFGHEVTISPSFTRDPGMLRTALPEMIAPDAPTPLWRGLDAALDAFRDKDAKSDGGDGARGDRARDDRFSTDRARNDRASRDRTSSDRASGDTPDKEEDLRPVILVLSDGKDSGPINFRQRYVSQVEVIERARAEDVMIYGIGMRSRGNRSMQPPGVGPGALQAMLVADLPDPGLARVAQDTGGGYTEIRFGQDLGAAFAQVADELHSQYLIGFAPPKRDGKVHEIEVKVSQRGLKPRARKNYVAPKEASNP